MAVQRSIPHRTVAQAVRYDRCIGMPENNPNVQINVSGLAACDCIVRSSLTAALQTRHNWGGGKVKNSKKQ